ncbi:MAG TPA: hypothetical protein VGE39_03910 [Prosthecobacter sp.]
MNAQHLALTLFLSTCLLTSAAEPVPATQALSGLPQTIARFYADTNFVSCFSTAEERALVNMALKRRSGADETPSGRLGIVMLMTQRLRESFHEVDPKFVHWGRELPKEEERVVEPVSMVEDQGEIRVTTHIWTLKKEQNALLVSQYAMQAEALKTLAAIQQQPQSRTEVHVWKKHGQRWLRETAVFVPLKQEQ